MRLILIFSLALLVLGCNRRVQSVADGSAKERSLNFLLKSIESQQPGYMTMTSDVRLDGTFEGQRMKFRGNLIHVKDSLIWMNMTKFGLEVGRFMITRDSFLMLNRLTREYISEPISYLAEYYNIMPEFDIIENALVGVPGFPRNSVLEKKLEGNKHLIRGSSGIENILLSIWLNGFDYGIDQAIFEDDSGRKIVIDYDLEAYSKDTHIPPRTFNTVNIDSEDYVLSCTFENIDYDKPQKPKFKIPRRYDRVR